MQPCNYCNENVTIWMDKNGDIFTHICKECAKTTACKPDISIHFSPIDALKAIRARLDGDFDNASLIKFGPLSTSKERDIYDIISMGMGASLIDGEL